MSSNILFTVICLSVFWKISFEYLFRNRSIFHFFQDDTKSFNIDWWTTKTSSFCWFANSPSIERIRSDHISSFVIFDFWLCLVAKVILNVIFLKNTDLFTLWNLQHHIVELSLSFIVILLQILLNQLFWLWNTNWNFEFYIVFWNFPANF